MMAAAKPRIGLSRRALIKGSLVVGVGLGPAQRVEAREDLDQRRGREAHAQQVAGAEAVGDHVPEDSLIGESFRTRNASA